MASASSTSIPRYLTVLSNLGVPKQRHVSALYRGLAAEITVARRSLQSSLKAGPTSPPGKYPQLMNPGCPAAVRLVTRAVVVIGPCKCAFDERAYGEAAKRRAPPAPQRASAVVGVATGATAMIAAARAVRNFLMGFTSISGLVIGPRNCQSSNRQSSSSSSNLKDRQSARHRGAADAARPRRRDDRIHHGRRCTIYLR